MKINIDKEVELQVPAKKAWDILWSDYANVGSWATVIPESNPRHDGAKLIGRTCSSTYGDVQEIITHHDEQNLTYSYEADGLPSMFNSGKNRWKVSPISSNRARVTMELRMEMAALPGLIMGWMIKLKMNKDLDGLMEDLKHFAERGRPHPKKRKSLIKWERHKAKKAA